jgi:putative oxidoreductase
MNKTLYSENYIDLGLLLLRLGFGIAFIFHGYPKLFMGGAAGLAKGLAAAGIPGLVMAFTMLIALVYHLSKGDSFIKYSHALESGIVFLALIFTGPGKFSFDKKLFGSEKKSSEHRSWELKTKTT